jgi:hypothetical protein
MHRAKIAQARVRMEAWRQRRAGSNGRNPQEGKEKNTLDSYQPTHGRRFAIPGGLCLSACGYARIVQLADACDYPTGQALLLGQLANLYSRKPRQLLRIELESAEMDRSRGFHVGSQPEENVLQPRRHRCRCAGSLRSGLAARARLGRTKGVYNVYVGEAIERWLLHHNLADRRCRRLPVCTAAGRR